MRNRVIICRQDSTGSANTDGQIPEDEEQWCERWAKVEPLRGRERFAAAQTQADVDYRVTVHSDRWTKQITPNYWIVEKETAKRLNVVRAYDPDGGGMFIEMECRQRIE
jgi:SPP1 family predicted phage head-tail adaptor